MFAETYGINDIADALLESLDIDQAVTVLDKLTQNGSGGRNRSAADMIAMVKLVQQREEARKMLRAAVLPTIRKRGRPKKSIGVDAGDDE